jgi:hypothetical protein
MLEEAVRWVIIIIIFVFDPLAVLMLIASQYTFKWAREDKEQNKLIVDSEGTIVGVSPTSHNEVNYESIYPYPAQENKTQDTIEPKPNAEEVFEEVKTEAEKLPVEDKTEPVAVEEQVEESKKKPLESLDLLETQPLTEEEIAREQEYLTKELDSAFQNSKTDWKFKNPDQTLKMWKMLYIKGKIDKLPWEEEIGYKQNSEQSETTLFKKLQERKAK